MAGTTNADLHSFNFRIKSVLPYLKVPFWKNYCSVRLSILQKSRKRQMSFPVEEFPDRVDYIVGLRSTVEFESFCIRHGDICPSHPHDWSVQVVESWALHHLGANLSPNPMLGPTTCQKISQEKKIRKLSKLNFYSRAAASLGLL